jgi:SAM-dependent methyltransferase
MDALSSRGVRNRLARGVVEAARRMQRRAWRGVWRSSLIVPASRHFGFERGTPVDRHYIQHFLRRHAGEDEYAAGDIRGRVLEVAEDRYARQYGRWGSPTGKGTVERVDVVDLSPRNPKATLVGDLTDRTLLPDDAFDCVICTQTLMLIYDVRSALANLHRSLRPGGVLLITVAGISRICRPDVDLSGDYWRFTALSLRRLLEEIFPPEAVRVEAYGNVLSATAALYGMAANELSPAELDLRDPDYEVIVAGRAVKPGSDVGSDG